MPDSGQLFCLRCCKITKFITREELPQIIAVSIKNLLLLEFGLSLGFPTILVPSLSGKDLNEDMHLDTEEISWIGSLNLIWIAVGCVLTGPITHAIGRKRTMQLITIPYLISWILFYFSTTSWHIFLALSITGFACGLLEAPVITYVAEVTQPHLRGILTSVSTMSILIGFLFQFLLGSFLSWRLVAILNTVTPIICLICLFFIPESPIWLLTKNRTEEAKKSLAWLRGWTTIENVRKEFEEMSLKIQEEIEQRSSQTFVDSLKFLLKKEIYLPMTMLTFIFFLAYFSGTTTLATYAVNIFSSLKAPIDEYYATVILGIMQILGILFCACFINLFGKRVIAFISLIGLTLCFLIVTIYIFFYKIFYLDNVESDDNTKHWIPVIFLLLSSFIGNSGIINLPWILTGELFPNEDRAKASGIAAAIAYVMSFIANKIFPGLVDMITLPGVFLAYSLVTLFGLVFVYFVLPETEGKTLHEIADHFKGITKLDNNVERKKNKTLEEMVNTNN